MTKHMRGALIEYGSGLIGPIPNVVIFQFNPDNMIRTLQIPPRPGGVNGREQSQAGDDTIETISFKAEFDASDALGDDKFLARTFGIGPQLTALEKMAAPSTEIAGLLGKAVDAIGGALGSGGGTSTDAIQPIPRVKYPKILFLWGLKRVMPVTIDSLRITEQAYDSALNPTRAEVDIQISVHPVEPCSDDLLAKGAMQFTTIAKEAMAMLNLANTAEQVVELIPF